MFGGEWNEQYTQEFRVVLMGDWLAETAIARPEQTAVVDADDGSAWKYRELDAAVEDTVGWLSTFGVEWGDHVAVMMETSTEFVHLVHAAMRIGAVLVPLNIQLTSAELDAQLSRVDPVVLVYDDETRSLAADVSFDDVHEVSASSVTAEPAPRNPVGPDDPQVILFTSGTTGDPKAVVLTRANLEASANASAERLGVTSGDRWFVTLSMYHMGGLAPVLRSVQYGTAVVVTRGFDPEAAVTAIDEYGCTGVSLVPVMLRRILDARGGLPSSLRFVLLGGAPASRELIERCESLDVPIYPTYGMTETASQVATATPREAFAFPGTVGRPLASVSVSIDGGDVGEIVVDGPIVMAGYFDDPVATDAVLGPDGFHTGDVGYLEDGRLWVLNRRTDRIVTGGENVHPGEVAAAIRSLDAVRDVAVVGLSDEEWGERVAALVELAGNVDETAIRRHLEGRLARFKHPKTIGFTSELPRTASGTVDRKTVAESLEDI